MSRVLLYSGGMDSEAARILWEPDLLLYVDMGTGYSRAERARLPEAVEVVELPLDRWERPDGIIPMRNLMLVAIASIYGDQVGLAATAGDRVLDKSTEFAVLSSGLLSFLWQPQHWTDGGRDIEVVLPVKHLSKRGLIEAVYAKAGPVGVQDVAATLSCYEPDRGGRECGACKPCTRKWTAFAAAGKAGLLGPWASTARATVAAAPLPHDRGPAEVADVEAALAAESA